MRFPIQTTARSAAFGLVLLALASAAMSAEPQSEILTIENKVSYMAAKSADWQPAKPGQVLKIGDKVRTGKDSRATVRLADLSVLRINEQTTFELLPSCYTRAHQDRGTAFDSGSGS